MSEQAGRELDALVAEKVFGWKYRGYGNGGGEWTLDGQKMAFGGRGGGSLPHYSTSIAAAWEVVGRLAERGIFLRIEPGKDLCVVRTWDGAIYEDANTAPLAICLAAIKAISNEAP